MDKPSTSLIQDLISQGHSEVEKNRELDGKMKDEKWYDKKIPSKAGYVSMSFGLGRSK